MTEQVPANWHPDPFGRHELRYWDGGHWTQHVASRGRQEIDPPVSGPPVPPVSSPPVPAVSGPPVPPVSSSSVPTVNRAGKKVQREVRRAGVAAGVRVGGGTLFTEPVLVVNQKAKLIEVNAEYVVYGQHGQQIGAVREIGQNFMKAMVVPADTMTHRLQVVDLDGRVLIALTRPAKVFRSKVMVRDANGAEIGQIVQKNFGFIGKFRFVLESGGQPLGSMNAEDWNAWDFNIQDATGNEIARITKASAGLAKEWFTTADSHVVQIHRSLDEPLRSLVIAAALGVDTALMQDRGQSAARSRASRKSKGWGWDGGDDGDGGGDG